MVSREAARHERERTIITRSSAVAIGTEECRGARVGQSGASAKWFVRTAI